MYSYGDVKVGDLVLVKSRTEGHPIDWYLVKEISDSPDFSRHPHCQNVDKTRGFLIDDGFMDGRGSFIAYGEVKGLDNNLEEIEI